jgi:hypothetical protein
MTKILITEKQLERLLEEYDKNELVKIVEKFLEDNFEVSGDIQYHKLTDGRGKMITFKYGDEYFKYSGSKKSLKNQIVNYIKDEFKEKDLYTVLNTAVKNFIDKNIK